MQISNVGRRVKSKKQTKEQREIEEMKKEYAKGKKTIDPELKKLQDEQLAKEAEIRANVGKVLRRLAGVYDVRTFFPISSLTRHYRLLLASLPFSRMCFKTISKRSYRLY